MIFDIASSSTCWMDVAFVIFNSSSRSLSKSAISSLKTPEDSLDTFLF